MFANAIWTVNGASSAILDEIASQLEEGEGDVLFGDHNNRHLVAHIFSNDCPNISSAMKARYEGELGYVSVML